MMISLLLTAAIAMIANIAPVDECKRCIVLSEQSVHRAAIADLDKHQIIWEWRADQAGLPEAHVKWFTSTSDAKPVYDGKYILLTASGGGVALVRIADHKTMFYAYAGGNPHSAELLPDGNIVVAASHGNSLTLFKVDTTLAPEKVYKQTYPAAFAHNVVWDKQRQVLWTAAMDKLIAFKYNANCTQPTLVAELPIDLPGTEAHDLFPVYGADALWFTNTTNVYTIDLNTKKCTLAKAIQGSIKSVSSAETDFPVLLIKPKTSWWTDEVIDANGKRVFYEKGLKIYKARWFVKNGFSYPDAHNMMQCN